MELGTIFKEDEYTEAYQYAETYGYAIEAIDNEHFKIVEKPVIEQHEPTIDEQNEEIRATRELLYVQTSDKLKADYDEAVARGSDNIEELKTAWLESKDKIREENPYIIESEEDVEEVQTEEEHYEEIID